MDENMAEIEAIASNTEAASFASTVAALERSGRALAQVSAVFHALAGAHTNDAILALEREMSPRLAAHRNRIQLHGGLHARIKALWDRRGELGFTGEQARVLERYEVTFRRLVAFARKAAGRSALITRAGDGSVAAAGRLACI
jgi:peptidyl-dipeptidase Dcp